MLETCIGKGTLNGYDQLDSDIQDAIMENFRTGVPTAITPKVEPLKTSRKYRPRKKWSSPEISSDEEEQDNRSSTESMKSENEEDVSPEIEKISDLVAEMYVKASNNRLKKPLEPLMAANEMMKSDTETELQKSSRNIIFQVPKVEVDQLMTAENDSSKNSPEATTINAVRPVQDAQEVSEYEPVKFTGSETEVFPAEIVKPGMKSNTKARGKKEAVKRVAERNTQTSQAMEILVPRFSRSGRKVPAS